MRGPMTAAIARVFILAALLAACTGCAAASPKPAQVSESTDMGVLVASTPQDAVSSGDRVAVHAAFENTTDSRITIHPKDWTISVLLLGKDGGVLLEDADAYGPAGSAPLLVDVVAPGARAQFDGLGFTPDQPGDYEVRITLRLSPEFAAQTSGMIIAAH